MWINDPDPGFFPDPDLYPGDSKRPDPTGSVSATLVQCFKRIDFGVCHDSSECKRLKTYFFSFKLFRNDRFYYCTNNLKNPTEISAATLHVIILFENISIHLN